MKINKIDTLFMRKEFCGVFHVENQGVHSLVEVGSTLSVPYILSYLNERKIDLADIKNVFITHVHLDHSGGAGLLLQSLPNAKIYTHSAGVAHIVDPHAKLVPGAVEVYGQEVFNKDYPGIVGCDASRVFGMKENDVVDGFRFIEAHGHAYHHCMFLFEPLNVLFSGDGFGFAFKEINHCPLLCTSPTQFDFKQWINTVEKVIKMNVNAIQPTHFERFEAQELPGVYESVRRQLQAYNNILLKAKTKDEVKQLYLEALTEELSHFQCTNTELAYQLIYGDINVDGLWYRVTRMKK